MSIDLEIKPQDIPNEYFQRSLLKAFFDIFFNWFIILGAIWLFPYFSSAWMGALIFLLIGIMQQRMMNLGHHSLHSNFSNNRNVNDFLGRYFLVAPLFGPFDSVRINHLAHHQHLGKAGDHELPNYDLDLNNRRTVRGVLIWVAGNFFVLGLIRSLGRYTLKSNKKIENSLHEKRVENSLNPPLRDKVAIVVTQVILFSTFFLLSGLWYAYFVFWILPGMSVAAGLNTFRNFMEHFDNHVPPQLYITFLGTFLERITIGSYGFNYHAEHHKYMRVPYNKLKKMHIFLKNKDGLKNVLIAKSYYHHFLNVLNAIRMAQGGNHLRDI